MEEAAKQTATIKTNKRPFGVWVISILYFAVASISLYSTFLLLSDSGKFDEMQSRYIDSLTFYDYLFSVSVMLANLTGAILLFMRRRHAYPAFLSAFGISMVSMVYQIFAKDWLKISGNIGIVATFVGYGIAIAVILYVKRLVKEQVLR